MKNKLMILVVIVMICIFGAFYFFKSESNGLDSYGRDIKILNENYPTDIVVYGEDIPFRDELVIREVNEISPTILQTSKEYQVVLLSDINGTLEISNEELLFLKYLVEDLKIDFYYLGTDKIDRLIDLGFYDKEWPADDYCFSYVKYEGRKGHFRGIWAESDVQATNNDKETMALLLVNQFAEVVESNN